MGRFLVETSQNNPQSNSENATPSNWRTSFPKESIGIDRNGVIVEDSPIYHPDDIRIIPGCLEAIKTMRLKGYKVFIFFNEPMIGEGKLTQQDVDAQNNQLMQIFGQAGILSIEGILYSTTNSKLDLYALPNLGMIKKAEKELKQKFKGGYFVGNKITDLKTAMGAGSKPIFIKTGNFEETEPKLNTFANKELKSRTKTFSNLLEFANSLP